MSFSNRNHPPQALLDFAGRSRGAKDAADHAIDAAEAGARREFLDVAQRAGEWLAGRGEPFTSADVRDAMERNYPNVTTRDDRALGAVMRRLVKRGVIAATGRYVKSNRSRNHNRPLREWIGQCPEARRDEVKELKIEMRIARDSTEEEDL